MSEDRRVLGNEILDAYWDGDGEQDDRMDEIENMDMHLEICLRIMRKNA
jgi:hypothetical protein